MISDYNNPYFYQTPTNIKGTNPFVGYQYPVEINEMKYNPNVCPADQPCEYPPTPYYSYPSTYVSNQSNASEQSKTDDAESQPAVKYEYQEPEENFISIDDLQYNPSLLKMILPDKIDPEKIKERIKTEDIRKDSEIMGHINSIKIKTEPVDVPMNVGGDKIENRNSAKSTQGINEVSDFLSKVPVKVEADVSKANEIKGEIPGEVQVKTEPSHKLSMFYDSDEEIDENEQGVEFNWMDLEGQEKQDFECPYCGKSVSSNYNLRRHMMTHTDNKPFGCDICLKCFREFSDLKKHRRSHRNNPGYKCLICRENRPDEKDGAKCSACNQKKVSPYGSDCLEEVPTIEGFGEKKSFICPDCGRIFGSRHNLRRHYMIHTGAKPYPCDVCDKSFREVSTLKKHMLTHSRMKMFKCLICDREYNDYQAFVRHKNGHGDDWRDIDRKPIAEDGDTGDRDENGGEYLFECNECGKRFSDVGVYKGHLKVHSQYFTFQCYICKLIFKKREKLNSHMVTHSFEISDSE